MIVRTPRDSKIRWNISNSVSVGRPRQSTIAIAGALPERERCARSIALSCRLRTGTTRIRKRSRNRHMTGSDANTCASSSLYAMAVAEYEPPLALALREHCRAPLGQRGILEQLVVRHQRIGLRPP